MTSTAKISLKTNPAKIIYIFSQNKNIAFTILSLINSGIFIGEKFKEIGGKKWSGTVLPLMI